MVVAEGAAVDREARIGIILLLFLLVVISVGCNRAMIPVDDLLEFRVLYNHLADRVQYPNEDLRDGADALRRTLDNWCRPWLDKEID